MKQRLKGHCAFVISRTGLPGRSPRVVVLAYHSVAPTGRVTPKLLEAHLAWIREHCEVIRFQDALDAVGRSSRAKPAVAVTFDDGYRDNYDHALPLLLRYGVPATFFLTVGLIENDRAVVERLRSLRGSFAADVRPLEWGQIVELHQAGHDLGAHTYSHPNLARLGEPQVELELRRSKDVLEHRLGEEVTMMAYPFGKPGRHLGDKTIAAAQRVGYALAATTVSRGIRPSDRRLALPRVLMLGRSDDVPALCDKVRGAWDFLGRWQERAPAWAARLVSPDDFRV